MKTKKYKYINRRRKRTAAKARALAGDLLDRLVSPWVLVVVWGVLDAATTVAAIALQDHSASTIESNPLLREAIFRTSTTLEELGFAVGSKGSALLVLGLKAIVVSTVVLWRWGDVERSRAGTPAVLLLLALGIVTVAGNLRFLIATV
jgi:hypothetical protein